MKTGADQTSSQPGLHFERALLPDGWAEQVRVCLEQGRIAGVERNCAARAGDERASIGVPGLHNLHSHAFQRGMAGLAEQRGATADSFWTWRELMYRFAGGMEPEDLEALAAQAYVEMLEAGFTRVGEFHYVHHDRSGQPYANLAEMGARVAAAAGHTGIGLTLLPVFYAHGGFGGRPPNEGQRRFINDTERYVRLLEASRSAVAGLPDALVGIAPHSLRAVQPEELAQLCGLPGNHPIHIHIAEQVREVEDCKAWSGRRPVQWLMEHAPVDGRWCLVHATHITEAESSAIVASGAVAGLCPITEANLGDGIFPAVQFLAAGGLIGIGSDSNVLISAAEELRLLEYTQRLQQLTRNALAAGSRQSTGRTLYDKALAGGARALGIAGGIAAGASADLVSLNPDSPAFAGRSGDQVLDSFIFATDGRCIDSVWRAGRKVVSNGRHHDRDAIARRFCATVERLLRS